MLRRTASTSSRASLQYFKLPHISTLPSDHFASYCGVQLLHIWRPRYCLPRSLLTPSSFPAAICYVTVTSSDALRKFNQARLYAFKASPPFPSPPQCALHRA